MDRCCLCTAEAVRHQGAVRIKRSTPSHPIVEQKQYSPPVDYYRYNAAHFTNYVNGNVSHWDDFGSCGHGTAAKRNQSKYWLVMEDSLADRSLIYNRFHLRHASVYTQLNNKLNTQRPARYRLHEQ